MTSPAPAWRILRAIGSIQPVPWSNGAGTTRQLVAFDESAALSPAGTARWRLSIAVLQRPGDFSPLPGIDRTFLLVGADAALSVDGERHELHDGDVLRFGGDQAVVLESLAGACHAVNLMVERAEGMPAPHLTAGMIDAHAQLAVALRPTADVARFDLLARMPEADGPLPEALPPQSLPGQAASLTMP